MKHFSSLGDLAAHLATGAMAVGEALELGLDHILERIEKTAKAEFGHYQPAVGPFPAWAELADATKADRVAQGYTANDPLLRSGGLRDSVKHERRGLEGVVGSEDPVMLFQELGTSTTPARPVLGPAVFVNKRAIEKLAAAAVVAGLVGGQQIREALGYDFKTRE